MAKDFKLPLGRPFTVRVRGRNEKMRELPAILSLNSTFTIISKSAALDLGFPEASARVEDIAAMRPDLVKFAITIRGFEKGVEIRLPEIIIGDIRKSDYPVLVLEDDISVLLPIELIISLSFFSGCKLTLSPDEQIIFVSPRD